MAARVVPSRGFAWGGFRVCCECNVYPSRVSLVPPLVEDRTGSSRVLLNDGWDGDALEVVDAVCAWPRACLGRVDGLWYSGTAEAAEW